MKAWLLVLFVCAVVCFAESRHSRHHRRHHRRSSDVSECIGIPAPDIPVMAELLVVEVRAGDLKNNCIDIVKIGKNDVIIKNLTYGAVSFAMSDVSVRVRNQLFVPPFDFHLVDSELTIHGISISGRLSGSVNWVDVNFPESEDSSGHRDDIGFTVFKNPKATGVVGWIESLIAKINNNKWAQEVILPFLKHQLSKNLQRIMVETLKTPVVAELVEDLTKASDEGTIELSQTLDFEAIPFLKAPIAGLIHGLQNALTGMGKIVPAPDRKAMLKLDMTHGVPLLATPLKIQKGPVTIDLFQVLVLKMDQELAVQIENGFVGLSAHSKHNLIARIHMRVPVLGEMIVTMTSKTFSFDFRRKLSDIGDSLVGTLDSVLPPAPPTQKPKRKGFWFLICGASCMSEEELTEFQVDYKFPENSESSSRYDLNLRIPSIDYHIDNAKNAVSKVGNLSLIHGFVEWLATVIAHHYVSQVLSFSNKDVKSGIDNLLKFAQENSKYGKFVLTNSFTYENTPLRNLPLTALLEFLKTFGIKLEFGAL